MLNLKGSLLSSALVLSATSTVAFAETPESDAYSPGESDSKWILGATGYLWENPYINEGDDDDSDVDDGEYDGALIPRVEYRGERFFSDSDGLGLTLFRVDGFSSGLILTGDASYLSDIDDYEDNDRLVGIEEREETLDLGFYVIHNHDNGQLKFTALQEITNEHDGQSADLKYTYNFPLDRWNITPVVGVAWASSDTVNHFVGVSERESLASNGIAAYEGDSATSIYGGVDVRFDITKHWDIHFGAHYVALGSEIEDSPLIEDNETVVSSFGFSYNF